MKPLLPLGARAKDEITGFSGVITARTFYLHGVTQVRLLAECLLNGKPNEEWFEEGRISESELSVPVGFAAGTDATTPYKWDGEPIEA
jgi:hypothetical protein